MPADRKGFLRHRSAIPTLLGLLTITAAPLAAAQQSSIVHDAEFYVLQAQHGEQWAAEDATLDQKLAELREKSGRPPNIIHVMWDDTAFGDVGIPELQKVRGLNTPNINKMAEDGILFTRMYTEVGCTPSRAASATGRLAVRSGMYNIGMISAPALSLSSWTALRLLPCSGHCADWPRAWLSG
ncbi:MAG: sulfatase-like hydrolase/transferase [Thiohalocapsa sp.]